MCEPRKCERAILLVVTAIEKSTFQQVYLPGVLMLSETSSGKDGGEYKSLNFDSTDGFFLSGGHMSFHTCLVHIVIISLMQHRFFFTFGKIMVKYISLLKSQNNESLF